MVCNTAQFWPLLIKKPLKQPFNKRIKKLIFQFSLVAAMLCGQFAYAGTISTFAGNGNYEFSGDGGAAADAGLNTPTDVVFDSSGNAYIADLYNYRIRKVDINGTITTFAGIGTSGYTGDYGLATQAEIGLNYAMAIDSNDNLYYADFSKHVIRKITPAGTITTVAGNGTAGYSGDTGPATNAQLRFPYALAVDDADNLYIGDRGNHVVRKVTNGGIITTVVGNNLQGTPNEDGSLATNSPFVNISGITVSSDGSMYISVSTDRRIYKITPDNKIYKFAGNGENDFSGDGGQALNAKLKYPFKLVLDTSNNLYFTDYSAQVVRKIAPSGVISTVAGTGAVGYNETSDANQALLYVPQGLAINNNGQLYFADSYNYRIRKVVFNNIPVITEGNSTSIALTEDDDSSAFNLTLNATDTEQDDAQLSWSIATQATKGTATVSDSDTGASQVINFVLQPNTNGNDSFVVQVSDGAGGVTKFTVSLTISAVNDTPSGAITISGAAVEKQTINAVTSALTDEDGLGELSYQWLRDEVAIADATSSEYVTTADDVSANLSVKVSYTDDQGTAESKTSAAIGPIKADLDGDAIADDIDDDIDGDGLPNAFEVTYGFNPRDLTDAAKDSDSDGVSNLDEFTTGKNPTQDDVAPVFGDLATVTIDATGLFTTPTAETLSAPEAIDGKDGVIVSTWTAKPLKSGIHTIEWLATDAAGNQTTADQTLHINPLVNFEIDKRAEEGGEVSARVVLSDYAAVYPVTVNYTVSGTMDSTDHTAVDGQVTIDRDLEAQIQFTLIDDQIIGEAGENVIFTMGEVTNAKAGFKTSQTITLIEANEAPRARLTAVQAAKSRLLIDKTAGMVTIAASVADPNPADTHEYNWSESTSDLVDTDTNTSNNTFVFDPAELTPGLYTLSVAVTDNGIPALSSTTQLVVKVLANPLSLDAVVDSDSDGIADGAEGFGDSDGDRIPDHLDAIEVSNVIQSKTNSQNAFLMEANPGLTLRLGATAFAAARNAASINQASFEANSAGTVSFVDKGATHTSQIFDFEVSDLPQVGSVVDIVMPLDQAVPEEAIFRKFDPQKGWYNFEVNSKNTLRSAPGSEGFCPSIGDASYTDGLTAGHFCLLVSIEDGGPNDIDGKANGEVIDPSAVGTPIDEKQYTVATEGGSFGWPWLLMLLVAPLARRATSARLPQAVIICSVLSCMLMTSQVNAQTTTSPVYLTLDVGYLSADTSQTEIQDEINRRGIDAVVNNLDTDRFGFGIGVGYQLFDAMAIEFGYQDLGEVDFKLTAQESPENTTDLQPISGQGLHLSGLYSHTLTDALSLRLRAGLLAWQNESTIIVDGQSLSNTDNDGVDPLFALGAGYKFSPHLTVNIELQRYFFDGADSDALKLGLQWYYW